MAAELQKPIREFGLDFSSNPTEVRVIDVLKMPTRIAADLFLTLNPRFWYGKAFKGDLYGNRFRDEYLRCAANDPKIRNPYASLDANWNALPITDNREVYDQMGRMSESVLSASNIIRNLSGKDEAAFKFAEHLREVAGLCLTGNFDGLMKACVERDQSYPIGWGFVLAETYIDPMKDRPVPQSWLTYKDKRSTDRAMGMISKLNDASKLLSDEMGYQIAPRQAQVVVANVLMLSGYLAEINDNTSKFREPSGFNLPNDPTVTDKSLIYLFKGRIEAKNRQLTQKLQANLGVSCEPVDLETFVIGHEHAHGYHASEDELQRFGSFNQAAREFMANELFLTLAGSATLSFEQQRRLMTGMLAYAVDDVNGRTAIIRDPKIVKDLDVESIAKEADGDYGLVGLITLKELVESGALKLNDRGPAEIDYPKVFDRAKERFLELSDIGRNGNPDKTRRFFIEHLSGLNLYPVEKPESLAS
jgi:hypothetical protein